MSDLVQWRIQRTLIDNITKSLLTLIDKTDISDTLERLSIQFKNQIIEEKKREKPVVLSKSLCEFLEVLLPIMHVQVMQV